MSRLIEDTVIAAVAAHVATQVAGVIRLEPGVRGLAGAGTRAARRWISGTTPAPSHGVRVHTTLNGEAQTAAIDVDVSVSGQDQAAAVGQAVQRAISRGVYRATDVTVTAVNVTILDIALHQEDRS